MCNGYKCLCDSCVNEVNNTYSSPGEMLEPCFHCEEECYLYDHGQTKDISNVYECARYRITEYHARHNRSKIRLWN